jgi:hypothetical protein
MSSRLSLRSILLTVFAASLFWALSMQAGAVIQLDDSLNPGGLPDVTVVEEQPDEENPESTATLTLILFVGNLVSQVLIFAGSVSIIFLIIAGANYIFAFGKDERIERGKRGVFWSIMGLLTILFSYAIVQGVIRFILQLDVSAN